MLRLLTCALIASLLGGCEYAAYFVRDVHQPIDALEVRVDPSERRDCLLVLMPGLFDTPDSYLRHGFVRDALAASDACDFVAVDAHLGYYREATLRRRVGEDILRLADARGYRTIWLVGISMGGLGALLVARDNPSLVDGIVLFAPFLGDERVVREVRRAGGLAEWEPPSIEDPYAEDEYVAALWAWLRGYVEHPDRMPPLYLGVGSEDRLAPSARLLARALPPARFSVTRGEHEWSTWRVLWRRLLRDPPWAPAARVSAE